MKGQGIIIVWTSRNTTIDDPHPIKQEVSELQFVIAVII